MQWCDRHMIIVIDILIPEGRKWNRHRKEFLVLMIFRNWPSRIPFPGGSDGKCGRPGFDPWVGKIFWRRAWQPTPVFLPGESHGQRSLQDCSPWGRKELDTTEQLSTAHRLMMLSISSYAYWSFSYLLWRNIYSNPLPIFKLDCLLLWHGQLLDISYWSNIDLQIFSPILWSVFLLY